MIELKPIGIDFKLADFAGVYSESLQVECPPGRLPADNDLVDVALFPQLFSKIGHFYTSGSFAGNGNEGTKFRLPGPKGRFLRPMVDANPPGTTSEDTSTTHTHGINVGGAVHGTHQAGKFPGPGNDSGYGLKSDLDENGNPMPDAMGTYGKNLTLSYTSTYGGDHGHTVSINNTGGAETRPYNDAVPVYVHTGQWSEVAVAIVYGKEWQATPDYNEQVPAIKGFAAALAKRNMHAYRIKFPEATAAKPQRAAHLEVYRQLRRLRDMYKKVHVIGVGTGAHLACLAMDVDVNRWICDKFVGIGGIYNLNGALATNYLATYINAYLGPNTSAERTTFSAKPPYVPAKCWHGQSDTVILPAQSTAWNPSNTVLVPNFAHDGNAITAGFFPQVIAWLES